MIKRSRHAAAFTLVELITAIVIIALIAGLSSRMIYAASTAFARGNTQSLLAARLSAAMERASGSLRDIPAVASSSPAAPNITAVSATSISWGTSGQLAESASAVNLTPNGGTAEVLLPATATLTITAFDKSGATLTLPLAGSACYNVHLLRIEMTATQWGVTSRLRTSVFLRNVASGMQP